MKRFLNDGTSKIFFNTKEYNKEHKESIKQLLEYIEKNRVSDNEFIKKLHKKIEKIKKNKDWRLEYMTILMNERQIAKSNYIKGKQEGIEEGKREGIEEGKREGIEVGKREGIEEGIKKLVLLCKEFNMEHKEIVLKLVEMYGLTEKEASKYLEN